LLVDIRPTPTTLEETRSVCCVGRLYVVPIVARGQYSGAGVSDISIASDCVLSRSEASAWGHHVLQGCAARDHASYFAADGAECRLGAGWANLRRHHAEQFVSKLAGDCARRQPSPLDH